MDIHEKVRFIIRCNGWTQQEAGEHFDVSQATIFRWANNKAEPEGKSRDAINELYETLMDIEGNAEAYGSEAKASAAGKLHHPRIALPELGGLPVEGVIQAGNWLDTTLFEDINYQPEIIPVARDPRFPHARQYALKVQGDSMNQEFPDGSFVTCVDFADSGLSMKDDLIVHVENWKFGLREITLKALKREGKGWKLEPRSTNPAHQPIFLNGEAQDGVEVRIRGVVVGDYRRRGF
ncbi:UNVERIFIED_ORG: S24 family peptidase [Roseateles sp. XES5]|nr:S24 family peptidase [Roseateles sp. XES5]